MTWTMPRRHLRIVLIAFGAGVIASLLAGTMTSGLAAAYALVTLWVWGIVAKLGGEALANHGWLLVLLTAAIHGVIFAGAILLARLTLPRRLKEGELGGNLFLVAVVLYGLLLSVMFLTTP
jgi:hypothetical protein